MGVSFHRIVIENKHPITGGYPMAQQGVTHTPNPQYDLVSALYHALKCAQTTDTYVKDAEQEGDKELAQFFRQIQQDEVTHADKAKQLLTRRVQVQ
jgi:uncharacterized protein YcbK (DUF882 family)